MSVKTVLIVDDEINIINHLERIFAEVGFSIVTSDNGRDAFFKLENQKFDLVITDLRMPKMDGGSLIDMMRSGTLNKKTPVIVISAYLDAERIKELVKYKISGILAKPLTEEVVKKAIHKTFPDLVMP